MQTQLWKKWSLSRTERTIMRWKLRTTSCPKVAQVPNPYSQRSKVKTSWKIRMKAKVETVHHQLSHFVKNPICRVFTKRKSLESWQMTINNQNPKKSSQMTKDTSLKTLETKTTTWRCWGRKNRYRWLLNKLKKVIMILPTILSKQTINSKNIIIL